MAHTRTGQKHQKRGKARTIDSTLGFSDNYYEDDEPVLDYAKLLCLLEQLLHKKGSVRVNALLEIIDAFNGSMQHEFSLDNFFTLMDRCEKFIQRGSSAVTTDLAAQILGLLALSLRSKDTKDGVDKANEIYRVSLSTLFHQLEAKPQPCIKVLECLAVVTSAGSLSFHDTEQTMKDLWQFILPTDNSDINGISSKHSASVLAAAISAWSYLLATMDVIRLDHKFWQGVIPCFLKLVEENNAALSISVIEAFALIFEMDKLEKFSSKANEFSSYREFKDEIAMQIKRKCAPKRNASEYLVDDKVISTSLNAGGIELKTLTTRSQLKKMNYLKDYLGKGFDLHLLENEFLHNMFQYDPKKDLPEGPEIYVAEVEPRMFRSPRPPLSKARSKQLKEQRAIGQRRKTDHCLCEDDTEVGFTSNAAALVLAP